jgi:hypothetical protein|nr:MAG TPA: hypothetical protein [Caudoviricetes sp.]DAW16799.1 MAG TPA: hypothetical protein [Caudoviricetes sp.]
MKKIADFFLLVECVILNSTYKLSRFEKKHEVLFILVVEIPLCVVASVLTSLAMLALHIL